MGAVLHTLNIRLAGEQIAFIANQAEDRVVLVDMSLAPLLAAVLPEMTSVQTVVAVGEGDVAPLRAAGKNVLRYDDLLDGAPIEFDWPDLDERSAAAMCYTSGTTGNPKGVVYSHRSSYLHSMSICAANGVGIVDGDRVLPIVPMFHANAWGQPYAAVMAGADLLLPDRYLQAAPLVDMIEARRPTVAAAVPTIWNDVLQFLHANPGRDISSPAHGVLWRVRGTAGHDEGIRAVLRRDHPPGLGHDGDLTAGRACHPAAGGHRGGSLDAAQHCGPGVLWG
jgi:fatty-acyl-CoA synthase